MPAISQRPRNNGTVKFRVRSALIARNVARSNEGRKVARAVNYSSTLLSARSATHQTVAASSYIAGMQTKFEDVV